MSELGWPKAWNSRSKKICAWPFSSPVVCLAPQAVNLESFSRLGMEQFYTEAVAAVMRKGGLALRSDAMG